MKDNIAKALTGIRSLVRSSTNGPKQREDRNGWKRCPIPGIINKRRRERPEGKGIGSNGDQTQTVYPGIQVKSRAGKPATGDDLGRSAHEVRRVDLADPSLEARISSEGSQSLRRQTQSQKDRTSKRLCSWGIAR